MAKTACINGHGMWSGDGGPCVEAYRVNFFRNLVKREPDCVILHDFSGKYPYIYDCTDDVPGEDLDIWYCDECGSFVVFVDWDKYRLDYSPCTKESVGRSQNYKEWEEYIAFRENSDDDDAFHDYCDGRNPLDALLTYGFKTKYYLSPDKEYIVKVEEGEEITKVFKLVSSRDLTLLDDWN